MPFEQRLQLLIGQQIFQIFGLTAELETARARIAELETAAEKAASARRSKSKTERVA